MLRPRAHAGVVIAVMSTSQKAATTSATGEMSAPATVLPPPRAELPAPRQPLHRIQARRGWLGLNASELWEYRELLLFQSLRDIKVRYKQTLLGAAWAIIQPLMTMLVFSIFFG